MKANFITFTTGKMYSYLALTLIFAGSLLKAMEGPVVDLPKELKPYEPYPGTEVYHTGGPLGFALRATKALPKGTIVAKFEGPPTEDKNHRHAKWMRRDASGKDHWIIVESTAVYVNHSCEPNSKWIKEDGTVRTIRDIAPGEDLTISYNDPKDFPPDLEWDRKWDFPCLCGVGHCPKIITGFQKK